MVLRSYGHKTIFYHKGFNYYRAILEIFTPLLLEFTMGARNLVAPFQNGTLNSISQILSKRFRRDRCHSTRTAKAQRCMEGFFEFFII